MLTTLIFALLAPYAPPGDSIGSETINGKVYVLHRVEQKETLYSISRRYGVTIAAIIEQNPKSDAGLEVGQVLKVPYVARPAVKTANGLVHKVAPKETLFSIAKLYGVEVSELRAKNGLTSDNLAVGQELVIPRKESVTAKPPAQVQSVKGVHTVAAGETLYSIARQYNVGVEELKKWNSLASSDLTIGQVLFLAQPMYQKQAVVTATNPVSNPVATPPVTAEGKTVQAVEPNIVISESVRNSDEIIEMGVAEVIEGSEGNRKYLALHRTAPTGSILKVKNEMNQREVFVRVVGTLPDTGPNNDVVIKISKSACDRMGVIDPRFRVQITYYK
jgi:LysM repeat protein